MDLCSFKKKLLKEYGISPRLGNGTLTVAYSELLRNKESHYNQELMTEFCQILRGCGFKTHAKKLYGMQVKDFHIGYVLTVIHNSLLHPDGLGGLYEILDFMSGDEISTHQIPRTLRECRPYLIRQFPQLATPEMDIAIEELREMLTFEEEDVEKLMTGWLAKQVAKHGQMLSVRPIPIQAHKVMNPARELLELMA